MVAHLTTDPHNQLQAGHRVVLLDNDVAELTHTGSLLSILVPATAFRALNCNLRDPSAMQKAAGEASHFFGGHLDVLVNNAANTAGAGGTPLSDMSIEEWNKSIETNLTAPMLLSQACLPMLRRPRSFTDDNKREHGGSIIHLTSTRAMQSEPNSEAYAATKAGLIGLTHSMAVSLAKDSITVNAIGPGWIHVENERKEADEAGQQWEDGLRPEDHEWHLSRRVGMVEDVWKTLMFLVESRFVNGSVQILDGGVTRKMVYPE